MSTVNELMLTVKAIAPDARLNYSEWTHQWYVEARIEVCEHDGTILRSVCEHRDSPAEAVQAFVAALRDITLDEVIVAKPTGERRHYRWNGAAFAEQFDRRLAAPSGTTQ